MSNLSTTSEADEYVPYYHHSRPGGTKPGKKPAASATPTPAPAPTPLADQALTTRAGILPLGPTFLVGFTAFLSIMFILVMTCAFIPNEDQRPSFASVLDDMAANTPGIVLIGDDVDVDIDEPELTIRWSVIACGQAYVLAGSEGTHGSQGCGLPAMQLHVFVDGVEDAAFEYKPTVLPFFSGSGLRHSIQNMFQFDDGHVLDVHEDRLYPFDTYHLTASFRVEAVVDNQPLPLVKLATISETSSFFVVSSDTSSFLKDEDGKEQSSRDLDLWVRRPAEARAFAMLLFGLSWMLAHITVGLIALAWNQNSAEKMMAYLAATFVIILLIPQMRNAMPDAPGYDGVLIDAIGFFPQMLICGASAVVLFSMMVKRELGYQGVNITTSEDEVRKEAPAPLSTGLLRMRRGGASVDISHVRSFSRKVSSTLQGGRRAV